jgi:hypothetical protein
VVEDLRSGGFSEPIFGDVQAELLVIGSARLDPSCNGKWHGAASAGVRDEQHRRRRAFQSQVHLTNDAHPTAQIDVERVSWNSRRIHDDQDKNSRSDEPKDNCGQGFEGGADDQQPIEPDSQGLNTRCIKRAGGIDIGTKGTCLLAQGEPLLLGLCTSRQRQARGLSANSGNAKFRHLTAEEPLVRAKLVEPKGQKAFGRYGRA